VQDPVSYLRSTFKNKDRPKAIKAGLIFILSGPSGSGKTTLAKRILRHPQLKGKLIKSVSYTTRPKRPGERQGRDYVFISEGEFQSLLKAKKILECTRYLGYHYGTSRDFFNKALSKGLHIILCIDIKGASYIKRAFPESSITIFVKPPSLRTAKQRILARCAKTKPGEVNRRIQLASRELNYINHYDYCVVNDNLNKTIKEIVNIIKQIL